MTAILSNDYTLEQQSNDFIQGYVYTEYSMFITRMDIKCAKNKLQRVRENHALIGRK